MLGAVSPRTPIFSRSAIIVPEMMDIQIASGLSGLQVRADYERVVSFANDPTRMAVRRLKTNDCVNRVCQYSSRQTDSWIM